jgi:S-adenosylmethionine decarboxylase proenzyme
MSKKAQFDTTKQGNLNQYFHLKQVIGDYIDCELTQEQLNSPQFLREHVEEAVKRSNTSTVKELEHQFDPQGYTLLMILADSSLSLHSWPEEKFISVEIFTCSERATPELGLEYLKTVFKPKKFKFNLVKR